MHIIFMSLFTGRVEAMSTISLTLAFLVMPIFLMESSVSGYLEIYPAVGDNQRTTPLYFGLIMSFPGGEFDGSGSIAGVKVALDRINSDPSVLPDYTLHYTLTNSKCNNTVAFSALFEQMLREPTKVALIGSGCSVATEPTAAVSQFYNITQISCVSSSTALSDRVRFQRYFQLLPSEVTLSYSYYGVIKAFGWQHVSIIEQKESLFTITYGRLKELLDRDNIDYDERKFETEDGIAGLGERTFDPNSRIHVIATYSPHARHLLCKAYQQGIKYPRHLLMTPAWYAQKWWLVEDEEYSCTASERESVLPTSLAFLHFEFLEDTNLTTTTGITGAEYFEEEKEHLDREPFNLTKIEYAQYCYDATWTLAYALDHTIKEVDSRINHTLNQRLAEAYGLGINRTFKLENFTYQSDALTNFIFRNIEETSFSGITGNVSFDNQGVRNPNKLRVYQFRNISRGDGHTELNWYEVGGVIYDGKDYVYVGERDIWPGGLVPYDGVTGEVLVSIALPVTLIFVVLANAGIIFATLCLVFNFVFRKKRLIKLTSPNLNYLIGIGAVILYLVIVFIVSPSKNQPVADFLCNFIHWLTAIGYSLCFGTIVAKMFRIYCIFNNPHSRKRSIKDWMLALMVLAFVTIDLILLVTYTVVVQVVSDDELSAKYVVNVENPKDVKGVREITTEFFTYICDSRSRDIFLGVLYGYKALIQVIAMVLAFSIRKVKVKGLNDTKFIVAIIYVTSLATALIIVAVYVMKNRTNSFAILFSIGVFIGTTTTLGLIFVPKIMGLYKDPEGKNVFENNTPSSVGTNTYNIESLKTRIVELENLVATLTGNDEESEQRSSNINEEKEMNGGNPNENVNGNMNRGTPHTIWDTNN